MASIDLELTPIFSYNNPYKGDIDITVWLHTPDLDIKINYLQDFTVLRDYNSNVADHVTVDFTMFSGIYVRDIHPYRDNLEMTIIMETPNEEIFNKRYKFVIINQNDLDSRLINGMDKNDLNTYELKYVHGELIDRELESLMSITVNAIYRDTTVKDIMLTELGNVGKYDTYVDGSLINPTLTLVEPHNTTQYDHIVISNKRGGPIGVKLLDLPSYLQNGDYGIYNANIGTYFQTYNNKPNIFVYPLYNTTRFLETTDRKLIIVRPSNKKLDLTDNTYSIDGDIIRIMCTSDTTNVDTGENDMTLSGTSYTYYNPTASIDRDVTPSGDSIRVDANSHLQTHTLKDRRDQNNTTVMLGGTTNLYKLRSNYVLQTMTLIRVTWMFCNMELIYPGMPVQYMFEDDKQGVVIQYGTVQNTYSKWTRRNHNIQGFITIALEKTTYSTELKGDKPTSDTMFN